MGNVEIKDVNDASKIELFDYYVNQARHTENLWLNISKFYTTLITAVFAAIAFLIKRQSDPELTCNLLKYISLFGLTLSFFAFCVVLSYQQLIREWVKKKELIETFIYEESSDRVRVLGKEKILPTRKLKTYILPCTTGVYLVFAAAFVFILIFLDPEWLTV